MGFIKALIGLPLVLVVLIFAFVNNDMANFSLWPTDIEVTVAQSVAIVFFVVAGYICGWFFTWLSYAPIRYALRLQKKENKKLNKNKEKLEKEVEGLHDNIESLKASAPAEEKTPSLGKIKSWFASKKDQKEV